MIVAKHSRRESVAGGDGTKTRKKANHSFLMDKENNKINRGRFIVIFDTQQGEK